MNPTFTEQLDHFNDVMTMKYLLITKLYSDELELVSPTEKAQLHQAFDEATPEEQAIVGADFNYQVDDLVSHYTAYFDALESYNLAMQKDDLCPVLNHELGEARQLFIAKYKEMDLDGKLGALQASQKFDSALNAALESVDGAVEAPEAQEVKVKLGSPRM